MSQKEIVYISSIFEKDKNRHFTNEAAFCQDLLRFYFEINKESERDSSFKLSLLTNWMVKNSKLIVEQYNDLSTRNTRNSYKAHLHGPRIKRKLEGFIECGLIHRVGTAQAEKVKIDVDLFSYTKGGKLVAFIMKSMNIQNMISFERNQNQLHIIQDELVRNNAIIYELLDSTLPIGEKYPYSNVFFKAFYKKVKEEQIFGKVVELIIETCCSNAIIEKVQDILESIYDFEFKDKADRKKFLKLEYKVFEEQNPELKNIFLHNMKLDIERRYVNKIHYPSQKYEREQFTLRGDYQNIVLEGSCKNCKESNIIICSYFDYKEKLADIDSADNGTRFDCQKCKKKYSCIVPNF